MELILLTPPNETLLAELYGWGELPIEWIGERGVEFIEAEKRAPNEPICMTSNLSGKAEGCDYTHIYMFPVDPHPHQRAVVKQQRGLMETNLACINGFRLHRVHDGVECFAFM